MFGCIFSAIHRLISFESYSISDNLLVNHFFISLPVGGEDIVFVIFFLLQLIIFDFLATLRHCDYGSFKTRFNFYVCHYLHKICPRKEDRVNEIKAYFEMNPDKLYVPQEDESYVLNIEVIPSYEKLTHWIEQYSKSKAFKNLVFRLCEPSKFGLYDSSLLKWAKNIPLMSVSENTRLELLKYNKFQYQTGNIKFVDNVDFFFSHYTEKQIKLIFFSSFNGDDYFKSLVNYASQGDDQQPLPVHTRMSKLMSFMNSEGESCFPDPEIIFEGECSLGKVIRIENKSELDEMARYFSNCAKSYYRRCSEGYYIFT